MSEKKKKKKQSENICEIKNHSENSNVNNFGDKKFENKNIAKENSGEKNNFNVKAESSFYSYANRSTQLDYFSDLINIIKTEKNHYKKKSSNHAQESNKNMHEKNQTANKNLNKIPIIEKYKFSFDITIRLTLNKFYNLYPIEYKKITVENLIYNKNCHLVSIFKDHMIFDYVDEFLKRFYFIDESKERIPKIANYYKNYLKFFCNPIFRDFKINNIIQGYGDYKAEMYYNRNYGNRLSNNECDNKPLSQKKKINQENPQLKKIFDTQAKITIDRNSLMSSSNLSIKNQIFNESNVKYYIDKFQCNKYKKDNKLEKITDYLDQNKNNQKVKKNNEIFYKENSIVSNTILEFSEYNLNDKLNNKNDINETKFLLNKENSYFFKDLLNDDISTITKYKNLDEIFKDQGKNFEKENLGLVNKNMFLFSKMKNNNLESKNKNENKIKNQDINQQVLDDFQIKPNNNSRNTNSNFNDYKTKTLMINKNINNFNRDNLNNNRSYEESIISLINIMDLNKEKNVIEGEYKEKPSKKLNKNIKSIEGLTDSQLIIREFENKVIGKNNKILENQIGKKLKSNSKKESELNNLVINQEFYKFNDKNSNFKIDPNLNVQLKKLNSENPYIIRKSEIIDNKVLDENNYLLSKLNVKTNNSNSNSKLKSNSKTLTDPNNYSNNCVLGVNTSKTLNNISNNTNNSTINLKANYASEKIKIDKNNIEVKGKSIFKPKINSVQIIKSDLNKQYNSYKNKDNLENMKNDLNNYYDRSISNLDKITSVKNLKKSIESSKEIGMEINLYSKSITKTHDSKQWPNKNLGEYAYKSQDKRLLIENLISEDKRDSISKSNSKEKKNNNKIFSTLDPSNMMLNSQTKLSLFTPIDEKSKNILNLKKKEIQNIIKTKNIIAPKNSIRKDNSDNKNNELINKISPSNKNGINFNNSLKTNKNLINFNPFKKNKNINYQETKKNENLSSNKNFDDIKNPHTKSAEIRNKNFNNPSTKTYDFEIINTNNNHQDQTKDNRLISMNIPQISLNYKINSRNNNSQNNNFMKVTNSNTNNFGTGNGTGIVNSSNNFNLRSENNFNNIDLKNSQYTKFKTTKDHINLIKLKEGIAKTNYMTKTIDKNSLQNKEKINKIFNSNSKIIQNKDIISKQSEKNYIRKSDSKNKVLASSHNIFNNNTFNFQKSNKKLYEKNYEYNNSNNSNLNNNEKFIEHENPDIINEINNNIIINNPDLLNKPNALADVMKITLSIFMDKSNSRNNRSSSNNAKQNSINTNLNEQYSSVNDWNNTAKKSNIINKIDNINKFNININNQFNLGDINNFNSEQLQHINNIARLNPNILINNTNNNNFNGILEYNSKKPPQNKSSNNKLSELNMNNINTNSNNLSNNNSASTHNGKILKFNEKSHLSEITSYGNPSDFKNRNNFSETTNFKSNQELISVELSNFNKTANLDNTNLILEQNKKSNQKHNYNSNSINSNLKNIGENFDSKKETEKLLFSQEINNLNNIIQKNKILSRNKNQNLFKISSNQNITKPEVNSDDDFSSQKIINSKTSNNHAKTNFYMDRENKMSSVFINHNMNEKLNTKKSDINSLKEQIIQSKAFNSYAHKGKTDLINFFLNF